MGSLRQANKAIWLVGCMVVTSLSWSGCSRLDSAACDPGASYGTAPDEPIQNFRLIDQYGGKVRLDSFCGDVIVLQMGAMWCPSCQSEANKIPDLMKEYGPQGLTILNLLAETTSGQAPIEAELLEWADYFDVSTPVLADPNWEVWERYFDRHVTPRAILVDREGRIRKIDYVITQEDIQSAINGEELSDESSSE